HSTPTSKITSRFSTVNSAKARLRSRGGAAPATIQLPSRAARVRSFAFSLCIIVKSRARSSMPYRAPVWRAREPGWFARDRRCEQGVRRQFAEKRFVFDREPAELPKAVPGRNFSDRRLCCRALAQRAPNQMHPAQQQIVLGAHTQML